MSLPQPLAAKIKSIPMDPLALANNVELAYMLSFSNYILPSDSVQCSPKESYHSPLQTYNFVNFDDLTYDNLYAETKKNYELKNTTTVKSIRNSFKQFFTRVSAMTYSAALKKDQLLSVPSTSSLKIPTFETQFKIDQMKGNNPNDWPRNLKQFHQQVSKLPWNAFACEPQLYFEDFFKGAFKALKNSVQKYKSSQDKTQAQRQIFLIVEIIIMTSMKTNNQTFILQKLQLVKAFQIEKIIGQKDLLQLVRRLQSIFQEQIDKVPVTEEQEYHAPKKLWEKGSAFMIMKKIHFQRQNGLSYFTVTNDGTYLYIYISSINGGMYKVGTGKNSSTAGKIYFEKQMILPVGSKLEEVNWVYCKGKLYLKIGSREPSSIQVINPENFKTQQTIQLKCASFFGHQSLINLNRNSILMTDGKNLYFLGKQLKIKQSREQKKEEQSKQAPQQQEKIKKKKSKKPKAQQSTNQPQKPNPEQIEKVLQFVLLQFDLNQDAEDSQCDQKLVEDLFTSFNGYFTTKQCKKALSMCDNDLSDSAQWLVDQGQKQRTTKTLYPSSKVVIAEADITSNFSEKNLKGSNQIITKQGSILHIQNIHQSIWTMDQQEVTCYSENGFKIFSKSSLDSHSINQNSSLSTTLLKTLEGKIQRNPQYTINYDPYNRIFYTFTWPTDGGHYFPTAVLIGSDYKQAAQLSHQKKISLSQIDPRNFNDLQRWMLVKMNMLDNSHCPEQGRVNDYLWYYAQKIIEINKEISSNNESDKKKLTNKRSKLLVKMNKVNQYYQIYQNNKKQFDKNGKVTMQIKLIPPFGSDGSAQNLQIIRNSFGANLEHDDIYDFIFCLEGWLLNSPKITDKKSRQLLCRIRDELILLKPKLNQNSKNKLNSLFITNFFEFFSTRSQQQQFIISLQKNFIKKFVEAYQISRFKSRKSIIYDIKSKDNIVQKYDSKSKFEDIFLINSNIPLKQVYESKTIGNLMIDSIQSEKKQKLSFYRFLEKQVIESSDGIKLMEHLFLEAFRTIVKNRMFSEYKVQLEKLFIDTFSVFQKVVSQSNFNTLKRLTEPLNQFLQIYFASLCSLTPCSQLIEIFQKILQQFQKKDIISLFSYIEDLEFQGISQTFQKIYETPHPIQRGKNQNFPPYKNQEAALIYAQFDKRCQSDPNHDTLSIQITHENSPVGNSINCNDGIFTTNLRLTGKLDSGKPYLIMGNSVNVDFVSSGHAKDAKSFGRFGFKFGLRPIFAGKLKYKKNGVEKIEKVFGIKSEFQKYINTLKLLTIVISNSIQNILNKQREQQHNLELNKFLMGKIFREGYQQEPSYPKSVIFQSESSVLQNLSNQKRSRDGRLLIMKSLHSDSVTKQKQNKKTSTSCVKQEVEQEENIWSVEGIPNYIRSYVEKIKTFNGDFVDVFLQARNLARPQGSYALQMRKMGFTEDMKKFWLQGEAILFLTVLKHSGLLHLNIKFSIQYIKQNLKAFQQARNGIYEALISRIQSQRQWRDLIQTFEGQEQVKQSQVKNQKTEQPIKMQKIGGVQIKKKGMPTRTIKLDNKNKNGSKIEKKIEAKQQQNPKKDAQKRKKQAQRTIRERLTEDYMIKQICNLKGIEYVEKQTFANVTRIIARIEKDLSESKKQTKSVYIEPMNQLIKSCIFLLKMKSPSTKQTIGQQQILEPESISVRCYSQDPRHVNANKVNVFRQWLENWKKWKQFKKEGKVQLKFPVSEIIDFVKSCLSLDMFKNEIDFRSKISQNRTKFYEYSNNLLKAVSNSFLSKYVVGAATANIKNSFNTGLESVSSSRISDLTEKYKQYSLNLKSEEQKKFKQFPLKLKEIQSLINAQGDNTLEKIKLASLHLYLIESENLQIDLDIPLYFIPLKFLSNTNQQLIFISSLIIQKSFLSQHSLDQIISKIWKQIGSNTISCKRWRDYFFIQRILFLMRKLENFCRQKLQVREKQKVAQVLFHMIYFLQIPLICRICLRILGMLKITLKRDIGTPLNKKYQVITFENQMKSEQLKFENKQEFNNMDLIAIKCYNVFKGDFKNQIKEKLLAPFKEILAEQTSKESTYTIILNMNQEEDVAWMVTVLYYLEQIEKTSNYIKDWEEYQSKKNKKKDHHKQKQVKQAPPAQEAVVEKTVKKQSQQRILMNIPNSISKMTDQIENILPVGWYFNYCNIYNDYVSKNTGNINLSSQTAPNLAQKKGKNANQAANPNSAKKQWNPTEFLKLYKKFEDLTSKPLQEPKQQESEEIKAEFVKAKNFISRMRKHSAEVSIIYSNLSQNGFYVFREDVSKQKCQIICQLFSLGGQNQLKAIPCQFVTKDYATKLSPAFVLPVKKSQLKITCIKSEQYKKFNDIINAPSNVQTKVQNNPILFYTTLGHTQFTFEDKCHLPYEQFPEIDTNQEDQKIQFSKLFIESGFSRMKKRHDEVYLKSYPQLKYFLSQGGLQSGLQSCILVPSFDSTLTTQKSSLQHIFSAPPKHQVLDNPQQLLEKTIALMKQDFQQIKNKENIIPYLLLSCYLQRLSKVDMKFIQSNLVKQFGEKLSKFIRGFKADHSIQKYRQKIQVLITKSLDSQNSNLSQFRLFRYDDDNLKQSLEGFVDTEKLKSTLRQQKKEPTQETAISHQIQKSNYQLPVHTPIPQQNKLLKYWQKNILPKIYEFVKSSLKPMQVEDFFQQMRIPLRKNDQLQAKKIAYVICDNKLPQGAVLPDANHNWNSLTIQDVTVGQDVILRLSKLKHESSSPLMWSQSQQYRVGQVMFIDQKTLSALIRHRLTQYGIFVYSWVPINSLQEVEESLTHYSLQTIYNQLESCLKGIIFNFAKTCITQITKKVKIEMDQLLQYTIIDMLRDNPISGWSQKNNPSLKEAIKLQLKEGKSNFVQTIESKFCPFEGYDIDLFSESMISLNKFKNSLGLVVNFKKNSTLIWYSGIKFYSDSFGFKQIANTSAGKSNLNQLQPLQFKNPNVYCKYFTNKQFLKAYEQNRYEQNQIGATIYSVDPAWTVSTYLANVIGQIAVQQNKYEDLLTRINIVFLKWLQKKQFLYLSTELCRLITKNILRIRKIYSSKQKSLTLQLIGTTEEQVKSILQWANQLKQQQDKDMLVLYSPLLQNLIQLIASIAIGVEKTNQAALNLPAYIQEVVKLIQMIIQIENNLDGKKNKKQILSNDAQWERILLVQNIPLYINQKEFRNKMKQILLKNNGKVLAPSYDIFYHGEQAVILVDSWDITELIEEEIIEKIQQEQQQKQPQPEEGGGLLMEWQCEVCTFINPMGSPNCGMCDSPAPAPKAQAVFEKVQTKDVNQTEMKLRQKQMKRFQNIKNQIKQFIKQCWTKQCSRIDTVRIQQEKTKEQKRKKKSKLMDTEQKPIQKPLQPKIQLSSGSPILQKEIIQEFLKKRFEKLPQEISRKASNKQNSNYLAMFKDLAKLGYDLWGDNISSEQPSLLKFEYLSELMQYIQDEICKGSSSVLSYNESSIRMINQIPLYRDEDEQPINFIAQNNIGVKTKYKRLSQQQSYNIRYSWRIIKDLNLSSSKCLQFINMKPIPSEEGKTVSSTNTAGANLKCLRQLIMGALKLQLFQKITQKTSTLLESQQIPKINLERLKIKQERETSNTQKLISMKDKDNYLFTKSHEQLQKISSINLRPFKPKGAQPFLSFIVIFKGQLVQGQAGPYRQFFTDITNQLTPEFGLGLFIKTPNNIHKTGQGRSKWTINPKANSSYYLSLFFFLGRLMGCCIRTGCHLPLDLANFCWKLIADESIKDLDQQQIDTKFVEQNKFLIECPSQSTFDAMQQIVGQPVKWVYTTIDGEQQELKPNGKLERVKYSQRIQYVQMMKKRRVQQISLQVQKIRQGLNQMIPQSFLNYISGQELKTMVCGVPKVDVQLLRKHTKYAAGLNEQSPIIKYFWEFMKQISEQQKFKLIRFCWGQERLPLNSQQFQRNGVRFMIKPMLNNQKPDQALPKADTCFFNIELPNYSSKQILKQRVLLAINLDNVSINADRNPLPDQNPLMGNVDYDDQGDGQDDQQGGGGGG